MMPGAKGAIDNQEVSISIRIAGRIAGSMVCAIAAGVLAFGAPGVAAKEWKMTAGASHPPIIPWVQVIRDYVVPESNRMLKELSIPDSIKWTQAYAGALYNFKNTLEGVGDGLADIGWVGTLWEPAKMPLQNVSFHAPFATGNVNHLIEIQEEMHQNIPAMKAAWRKHNAVFLGGQVADTYHIVSKFPLTSLDQLRGRKILAPGPAANWLKGTGATAVDVGLPIYYNSLKTGVADAGIIITTGMLPFKLHEVAPYIVKVDLGSPMSGALAMNLDTWKSLPPHMKVMFRFLGREYARKQTDIVAAKVRLFMKIMAKQGATITEFPAAERQKWVDVLPDLAGDWVKRNEAKGLPAKAVLSAFMDGVRKRGGKPARNWDKAGM